MFKNLNLGKKIGVGFATVLCLLLVVVGISMTALQKASTETDEYQKITQITTLAGRIQANMLMMRMSAYQFLRNKDDKSISDFKERFNATVQFTTDSKNNISDPRINADINQILQLIKEYNQAFESVVVLMRDIQNERIPALSKYGEEMRRELDSITDTAFTDNSLTSSYQGANALSSMLTGRVFVLKFIESVNNKDYQAAMNFLVNDLKGELDTLDSNLQNPQRRASLKKAMQSYNSYINHLKELNELLIKQNDISKKTLDMIGPKVANLIEDIKLEMLSKQTALGTELKEAISYSFYFLLSISLLAIVIGIAAAMMLSRIITKPIHEAVAAANQLAKGQLNINIQNTANDETGLLLNAITNTANNLKAMISTITNASNELESASQELAAVTDQTSQGIRNQESETDMVATAMNEMTITVRDVANNAAQAADAANTASNEAVLGYQVVKETISSINKLSSNINDSSSELSGVQQSVESISTILDVIKAIAEQTNLLALNAAIEAARAGEQGRGFAVVADEVRSLASRTQNSTGEIHNIIQQLQAGTQSTVATMGIGKENALACVTQSEKASAALESITNSISIINDMNIQIASAAEQQSSVAESINQNVVNVKTISQENSVAASQTKSSSEDIARLATQLNQLIVKFTV
ncbi:methyl-accepting chemotaxis protein [Pseudoalteromonas rhizosphaerae]|uniref:methyl-accepting chemotaxis protein n=1 Tax=Pseudoalteromonas rhizosphaerae TaxID=2518973 RepID=UPI0012315BCA|nr:methyl-accepting chemotaxis protein [Pseudoalteromonas rhizosphaerae]